MLDATLMVVLLHVYLEKSRYTADVLLKDFMEIAVIEVLATDPIGGKI